MFWIDEFKNFFIWIKYVIAVKILSFCLKKILSLAVCSDGYYGYNCEETCSLTCGVPGGCDRITGSCNGSCLPGWKGIMCEHGNYYAQPMIVLHT